ncbi:DNA-binding ferritin-like protein (Dps family) [Arthrobacter sp. JUb119]|uniref:DUF1048 domain-containing protein n=1 Tax=Micrococcaceae TaxID=1268 RepID=UPI000CFA8EC5|nr:MULTISPECIES: DUF1048 domain-containing protein [unclassified Arthrobacter]MCS3492601.1 DNA-binding ferritin-like protein (Dps family) [Arthrobacter sp. JUb119]PQZ88337.1 hypothetical protein CQ016_06225 [Arthrobacter sp. MYb222]PRB76878.1 hypothetical protein CQ012_07695 [Arthrobacter sp. MYb214]TDU30242.1 DNA-binding ferritin-like protein (Dps family) [Arthrobacter sp. JUb115]
MVAKWIEAFTGSLEQKKQYKQSMARLKALPQPYAKAAAGVQRYLLNQSGVTDAETMISMYSDLADLFEGAAANGTALRELLGQDPAEFADDFAQAYGGKRWTDKERTRLADTISEAENESKEQ